jgi:epoxide hydrolase
MVQDKPREFRINVPQAEVEILRSRLGDIRWPGDITHEDGGAWDYGMPQSYLRALVGYWRDGFDWRAAEARINGFDHYLLMLDDLDTHFIHQRSPHAGATPLLMVHGWPGSFVEFLAVIPRLTEPERFGGHAEDAFHVVCPSLPGYGFSAAATEPGMSPKRVAERHAALMAALGYDRYVVQGGDWGSIISRFMPDICPERMIGLHLNMLPPRAPRGVENPKALITPAEADRLTREKAGVRMRHGYSEIQGTKPQTLAYGLTDSPAGLAAWIGEKFHAWTDNQGDIRDALSWDDLLTNISLYWFTNTFASSIRLYREYFDGVARGEKVGVRCEVPFGAAIYPREITTQPKAWVEREFNLVHWYEAPKGGHFAAFEQPAGFADDLLAFHRTLKAGES